MFVPIQFNRGCGLFRDWVSGSSTPVAMMMPYSWTFGSSWVMTQDSLHVSALEVVHWSWHSLCFAACLVWWRYTLFFPSLSETKPFGLSLWMKLFFELEETLWSWPCEPESVHIWVAEESLLTGLLQLPAVCLNHNLVLIFLSSFSVHTYTDPPPVQINTLSKSTHTVLSIN